MFLFGYAYRQDRTRVYARRRVTRARRAAAAVTCRAPVGRASTIAGLLPNGRAIHHPSDAISGPSQASLFSEHTTTASKPPV
jgi:hypothetical protein